MTLGKNLKMLLNEAGVTVSQFSKDTGLNVHTIYSFINRDSIKIDPKLLGKITGYFGISAEDFINFPESIQAANENRGCTSYEDYFNKRMGQEKELVVLFRNLSDTNRTAVLNLMKNLNGE